MIDPKVADRSKDCHQGLGQKGFALIVGSIGAKVVLVEECCTNFRGSSGLVGVVRSFTEAKVISSVDLTVLA